MNIEPELKDPWQGKDLTGPIRSVDSDMIVDPWNPTQEIGEQVISGGNKLWEDGWDWDTCKLGPHTLPGICEVAVSIGRKLDVKSSPGKDGAAITDKGYEPAKIKIRCIMWLEDHKEALMSMVKDIHPKKLMPKKALSISHPATEMLGITDVYVHTLNGPSIGKTPGTKEIEIGCIEWFKSKGESKNKTTTISEAVGFWPGPQQDQCVDPWTNNDPNTVPVDWKQFGGDQSPKVPSGYPTPSVGMFSPSGY